MTDGRSRRSLLAAGGATLAGLAGCLGVGSAGSEPDGDYDVGMTAIDFVPERLEVQPGTEVVWRNTNSRTHTVTAYEEPLPEGATYFASGGFDSQAAAEEGYNNRLDGGLVTRQEFSHVFEEPGEYPYFCIPHRYAEMVGVVVVTEDAEPTTDG